MTYETDATGATRSQAPLPWQTPAPWLVAIGAACVVLGGIVAAATGPLELQRGSWLAAYLVLVGGVAQYIMGKTHSWFRRRFEGALGWTAVVGWNAGNIAVIAGVFTAMPYLVDGGGAALLVVLVSCAYVVIRKRSHEPVSAARQAARTVYVGTLVVLAVSVPIGLTLAHLRA